jgi:hypothetical protein
MDTKKIIDQTVRDGGGTFTRQGAAFSPENGYAVAAVVGTWMKIPLEASDLAEEAVTTLLHVFPKVDFFGTWVSDGNIHLDPIFWVQSREEAYNLAKKLNQKAIWSFEAQKDIKIF